MATKSPLAKKAKSTAAPPAAMKSPKSETFAMPMEVKNWIDQAHSTIQHLKGEVDRLKVENKELKAYKKWAEHRILRSDYE